VILFNNTLNWPEAMVSAGQANGMSLGRMSIRKFRRVFLIGYHPMMRLPVCTWKDLSVKNGGK
jgi:hypothetical protein